MNRKTKKGTVGKSVNLQPDALKLYSAGKRYFVVNGIVYFSRKAALEAKGGEQ